ncbi:MAG: MBL fold metallo-hydrolase [Bacteroidales bacterium]|nr:MBL fold metallo-hydrolase [Bacteroidales bacterium]
MQIIDKLKTWKTKSGYRIIQILSRRSNVFLLTNGVKNILIDTSPKYMWNKLQKRLNNLNVNHIDYLVLTHTHMDHAENSHRIKEKYKTLVIVHKNEASYLTSGNNIIPLGTNLFTRVLINLLAKYLAPKIRYKPCQYDFIVDTKFDLNDFGFNAYIMHTPGHTTGSMSVVIDNEVAIVGDTMFGVFKGSVFPPFADDIKQMINSWGKLLETNCSVFIPSHGSAIADL